MSAEAAGDMVAPLMAAFRVGDRKAGPQLVELLYPELRRMAAKQMLGERSQHTWQPTVLIHELYLELVKIKALPPAESERNNDKAAFFALAGQIMRRLLIAHARPLARKAEKVVIGDFMVGNPLADPEAEIVDLERLLASLASIKPELRTVVEMKAFEGLTSEEIARQLGCAAVTVNRYWQFARHWLRKELRPQTN